MIRDCELILDRIEQAVSGKLDAAHKDEVDAHVASCPGCATKLEDAIFVRGLFRNVEAPQCPDRVVDSILSQVDAPRAGRIPPRVASPARRGLARSVSWMGAVAAIVALLAVLLPVRMSQEEPVGPEMVQGPPSVTDVADAVQQLQMAFSVVSREMTRTTDILGGELGEHMSKPIRAGMNRAGRTFFPAPEDDRQGFSEFPPAHERTLGAISTWKGKTG